MSSSHGTKLRIQAVTETPASLASICDALGVQLLDFDLRVLDGEADREVLDLLSADVLARS